MDASNAPPESRFFYGSECWDTDPQRFTILCDTISGLPQDQSAAHYGDCNFNEICVNGIDGSGAHQGIAWCVLNNPDTGITLDPADGDGIYWHNFHAPPGFDDQSEIEVVLALGKSGNSELDPYKAAQVKLLPEKANYDPSGESFTTCADCSRLHVKDWPADTARFGIQVDAKAKSDLIEMFVYWVKSGNGS